MATVRKAGDPPFRLQPGRPSVVAALLAACLLLSVAGCAGITPLGPDASPRPVHLRSPIVIEAMRVELPSPEGACPAGYAVISAPGGISLSAPGSGVSLGPCFRQLGAPATFTSAAVTPYQPGRQAGASSLLITLPAADITALTAVTTTAYDARGAVEISVAGRPWAIPMQAAPLTGGQFIVTLPSSGQASQLRRLLVPAG